MALYLVTGGAGFIGSHLVEEIVRRGESVRVLDNLSTGNKENLSGVVDNIDFHQGDICDPDALQRACRGVDYVIHLAALSSVARSIEDPVSTTQVNVLGTVQVLLAARDARVQRVTMAATGAVYGNSPTLPRVETQAPSPLSPYALAKLTGEGYGRIFHQLFGLEFIALRYFNVFGPRQNPQSPYTGVLSKFISAYLDGRIPTIFGDGQQSRDFTYVANIVDATLRACLKPEAPGKVINVGTGRGTNLNHAIEVFNRLFGVEVRPRYDPPRAGDVLHSVADISLARAVLGYEPIIAFEEGLRRTIKWRRSLNA